MTSLRLWPDQRLLQLPVLLSLMDNIGNLGAPPVEGCAGLAAEQRIAIVAVDRGVE
jgi:hypothetical protein